MIGPVLKIALKSARFYFRMNLAAAGACAVACAAVLASLSAGDSLDRSLKLRALHSFGRTGEVASKTGGFFRASLLPEGAAAVLRLDGAASFGGASRGVSVLGVGPEFFSFAPEGGGAAAPGPGEVWLNRALAESLGARVGDEVPLAVFAPAGPGGDFVFSAPGSGVRTFRARVGRVLGPGDFGDFSLSGNQRAPMNAFLNAEWLASRTGLGGMANLALFADGAAARFPASSPGPEDFGVRVEKFGRTAVAKSDSWFMPEIFKTPGLAASGRPSLAWFVSEFECGGRTSPYGFALGTGGVERGKAAVNSRLADDLGAKPGDRIRISFYRSDSFGALKPAEADFEISEIIPMGRAAALRNLMPEFSGLTDAESCSDWNSRVPVDFSRVRELDRKYWSEFSYAPKLVISIEDAARIWGSPMGEASAFEIADLEKFSAAFSEFGARDLGVSVSRPLPAAVSNAENGVDFAGLFMGLSFFVAASAAVLLWLAVRLNVSFRSAEIREYRILGFPGGTVFKIFFAEFLAAAAAGTAAGVVLGAALGALLAEALGGVWSGVSQGAEIEFACSASSAVIAAASAFCVSVCAGFFGVRSAMSGRGGIANLRRTPRARWAAWAAGAAACLGAVALVLASRGLGARAAASVLFFAGSMAFISGFFLRGVPSRLPGASALSYSASSCFRRGGGMFAVCASFAAGLYLLMAVGLNRFSEGDLSAPSSGSGGFGYFARTAVPASGIGEERGLFPVKVREAARADCLNLNRVDDPEVAGLDVSALAARGAFSFEAYAPQVDKRGWAALEGRLADGTIPAAMDASSMLWSMKKKPGDIVEIDSGGRKIRFTLAASLKPSVFQGFLVVSDKNFAEAFPGVSGAKVFLAGGDFGEGRLSAILRPFYPSVETCAERLSAFDGLQNSYLDIFLQLGLAGAALGVCACAILAAAGMKASEREFAFLEAAGWPRPALASFAAFEYALAALLGACAAALSAAFVLPPGRIAWCAAFVAGAPSLVFFAVRVAFMRARSGGIPREEA